MATQALYHGPLGDILVDYMKAHGGFITREDLTSYKTVERAADQRRAIAAGRFSVRRRPPPPACISRRC